MSESEAGDPAAQRRVLRLAIALTLPVAAALWLALRFLLPPIAGIDAPSVRLGFSIGCIALAALLAFLPGIEAVAHERLFSPAIDPLAGYETRRLRVNLRYLQNTLEQIIIFAAGLALLSAYADPRTLVACTALWVVARWAFWIGYHRSSAMRALGAVGVLQSMIVLLYAVYRFGEALGGIALGLAPVLLFLAIEALLFAGTARSPAADRKT